MPRRETQFFNDCYYHIYNRGVNQSDIFFDKRNYYFFQQKVKQYLLPFSDVVAYCLMPNHFHLLICIKEADKITESLRNLFISYTKSLNKEVNRSGPLWEGRYKSKLVPGDDYLLHLTRYIHLNPVKAKLVNKPEDWKFSSYSDYIRENGTTFVNKNIVLNKVDDYRRFVESYQEFDKDKLAELLFD